MLSAISSNNQVTVNNDRLTVLAKAANINTTFELPKLIEVLQQQQLIDIAGGGIAVLGVTTAKTLQHTSDIFDALAPGSTEDATMRNDAAAQGGAVPSEGRCDPEVLRTMRAIPVERSFKFIEKRLSTHFRTSGR